MQCFIDTYSTKENTEVANFHGFLISEKFLSTGLTFRGFFENDVR